MAIKKARTSYIALPDKRWMQVVSLGLAVVCSLTLMVMSKTGNPTATNIRTRLTDGVAPVLSAVARPMDAFHDAGKWVGDMLRLHEENVALRNENIALLEWQEKAKTMQAENEALHALLNVVPARNKSFVTARIVSDLSGPYVHSALINGGSQNGVQKDKAAISDNGLVGRVVDVGQSSSRVLLLSDINSRIPVMAERTQEKSILAGNNSELPALTYLPANHQIKAGDRIVTSGDGGIFPAGIAVGVVSSVEGGTVSVQPYIDTAKVEFVSIVDSTF